MRILLAAAVALLMYGPQPADAQTPTRTNDGVITQHEVVAGIIGEIERRTIGRYYQGDQYRDERYRDYEYDEDDEGHGKKKKHKKAKGKGKGKKKGLPPGLAKRAHLPPGLQMQLDERGALPPGLAKRDLPHNLRSNLPRRIGEEYFIVDDDIVLVEQATGVVLDVIGGILRGRQGN